MVATKSTSTTDQKRTGKDTSAADEARMKQEFTREITDFAADAIPGGNYFKTKLQNSEHGSLVQGFIGDLVEVVEKNWLSFGLREVAMIGGDHLKEYADKNLNETIPHADKIKLFVNWGTDAAIVLTEPLMLALNAKAKNDKLREEIRAELEGFPETIRPSIIVPEFAHKNPVLAKLEEKLTAQFQEAYPEMLTSGAIGLAQLYSHKKHNEKVRENVDAEAKKLEEIIETKHEEALTKANEKYKNKPNDLTKERDRLEKLFQEDKSKLEETQNKLKDSRSAVFDIPNTAFGKKNEFFSELKPYESKYANVTTISIGAAAFLGKNSANLFKGEAELKNRVIAAEMIIYLSQQFREGEIGKDGIVHLDGLKAKYDVPEEWGREMKLDNFIGAIFNTHVYDQSGQIIPQRFHAKLQSASKAISDAILEGNNDLTTEAKLNPLALIELLSGKIMSPDGLRVANNEVVTQEVEKAIKLMPLSTEIDSYKYIEKLGKSLGGTPDEAVDNIKDKLRGMDSETRDFVALLIPKDVLVNEFELPANAIDDSRHRAAEFALDDVKQVLHDLGQKNDTELIDYGLNKAQVKLIKENYRHVLEDNDEELMATLRNREEHGLGFAILCAKSYMQELANGKKIIGYAANNIVKFGSKETEDNQEVDSVIDPENADIASTSQRAQKGENMVAAS